MNKQFVTKIMQAKQLEYQALKEIMPECVVKRIEHLENEIVAIAKELIVTMMNETNEESGRSTKASDNKVRKVTIE